jgi:hypothetical protein
MTLSTCIRRIPAFLFELAVGLVIAIALPVAISYAPAGFAPTASAGTHDHQWVNITGTDQQPRWTLDSPKNVYKCVTCDGILQGNPYTLDDDDD